MGDARQLRRGDAILFIDVDGVVHNALVTRIWPQNCCDLVIVTPEDDPRPLDFFTDVHHRSAAPLGKWSWCWPEECPGG